MYGHGSAGPGYPGDSILRASGTTPLSFTVDESPVFPRQGTDEGEGLTNAQDSDPTVYRDGSQYVMYYTADSDYHASIGHQHIKVATTKMPLTYTTPTITLKLHGLASGVLKLGEHVTAKGTVKPTVLAVGNVRLIVQRKQGGKWVRVTRMARATGASGAYRATYKPARKGSYRMRATVAKTATNAAATTMWLIFKVK